MDNYIIMDYYINNNNNNNNTLKTKKFKNKCEKLLYSYNECLKLNNYILGDKDGYKACEHLNILIKKKCSN